MELRQLQSDIRQSMELYMKGNDLSLDQDFVVKKLAEEFGEYMQAVLIREGKCRLEKRLDPHEAQKLLAQELADLLALALLNAELYDIDIVQALEEKWLVSLS